MRFQLPFAMVGRLCFALSCLLPWVGMAQSAVPETADVTADQTEVDHYSIQVNLASLLQKARTAGTVRVIVQLNPPFQLEGALSADQVAEQRATIGTVQQNVLDRLSQAFSIDEQSVKKFEIVPGFALAVDEGALSALMNDPNVAAVVEDVPVPPALYASIPLIDADDAWAAGYAGQGQVVAILDTGVNKYHPFLAGKVVSEACYSTNGSGATSLCPGGVTESTATDSGLDCNGATIYGCGHGTHVAGIAAGKSGASSGGTISGVARDANIIALKIFSQFTGSNCTGFGLTSPCVLTFTSDQIRGLEQVYALRNTFAIAAANMSLGGGYYTATCDSDSRKPIIDNLRNGGIATVISSGNNGYTNATGAPGCISTAITVGSTTKSDTHSTFSNAASWVDLLAPGGSICSSVNGWSQDCGTGYGFASGTSMAAPHVTGAWAVLKSKNGGASVASVENALESTGVSVYTGAGYKPRIDLDNALSSFSYEQTSYDLFVANYYHSLAYYYDHYGLRYSSPTYRYYAWYYANDAKDWALRAWDYNSPSGSYAQYYSYYAYLYLYYAQLYRYYTYLGYDYSDSAAVYAQYGQYYLGLAFAYASRRA